MHGFSYLMLALFVAVLLAAIVIIGMSGAGGFKRMTTIGGIYAVANPGGYDAVCFVEKTIKAMSCLPGISKVAK